YLASKGKNPTLAQEFLQDVVPTPEFQLGLYNAEPRRPALTSAVDQGKGTDPNIPKCADAAKNGTILPASPGRGEEWRPDAVAAGRAGGGRGGGQVGARRGAGLGAVAQPATLPGAARDCPLRQRYLLELQLRGRPIPPRRVDGKPRPPGPRCRRRSEPVTAI